MAILRSLSLKLMKLSLSFIASFKDMANAFCCTEEEERQLVLTELVPAEGRAATLGANSFERAHHTMFKQRLVNSTVHLVAHDGEGYFIPEVGNCIGTSEGPTFFSRAYCKFIKRWWDASKYVAPEVLCEHPAGGDEIANMVTFAADVGSLRIVPRNMAWEAAQIITADNRIFDTTLSEGGWAQNRDKQQHVINLRKRGQNKLLQGLLDAPDCEPESDDLAADLSALLEEEQAEQRQTSSTERQAENQGTPDWVYSDRAATGDEEGAPSSRADVGALENPENADTGQDWVESD